MFKKLIVKWFMPDAETISDMAAKAVSDFINKSDRTELIAKYGQAADNFTKIQAKITSWLRDGKIDANEKEELRRALLPLAQKLIEEVSK